ncbi:hypothetical protein HMPREF9711_01807 [Myroides odoratimimus CCUG 3837]|uniref:RagB/SusD family nutrient uptake outer membrane protein n=1 Tax=Myroides odoratimimus TaxID=76832 RepID=UPI000280A8E1|nr:RagB/SusD family nutrient uptake outer membrane protein [Myroides odoratimimus]EKB04478.1 hypothetical protein HMPREF9711_01807 [Myroides odoratimimus CCUG 3837]
MKIKYIKYILLSAVLTLGSCSDDYLDTYPTNSTSPNTAFKTTKNVEMAVNGLARIMTTQHIGEQGYNGEGTIKLFYGEYTGNNFRRDQTSVSSLMNGLLFDNSASTYTYYPWHYYYLLITNANAIIANVDGAEGPVNEKKYLKAQALTYRAYSYTMLLQLYGNRWQDSNNGEHKCLILRLTPDDPKEMPLSSQKDVYAQVYKDLDEAIQLFNESNYKRGNTNYLIDANVSHAVYARAALVKQDYNVALREATLAKKGYKLMSEADYKGGFATPTSEWIWSSYGALDETLHYYSYQAYIAYNSSSSIVRTRPTRISKEFYESIPTTDIRRQLFLDPTGYDAATYNATTGEADAKSLIDVETRTKFPKLQTNAKVAAFMQFKIAANEMIGVGHLNHFRSSEMYFIEAEALHFLGRDGEASKLLEELTRSTGRDASYTCNKTGKELFNEIVKYRGIELWGEGFDWFDYKRWNLPISRKTVKEGGNYNVASGITILPSANNKWTWRTPQKESDYNPNI